MKMKTTLHEAIFDIQADEWKRAFKERQTLRADRLRRGHQARYMAHADGYVMARLPGCMPFVIAEKEWIALPLYQAQSSHKG